MVRGQQFVLFARFHNFNLYFTEKQNDLLIPGYFVSNEHSIVLFKIYIKNGNLVVTCIDMITHQSVFNTMSFRITSEPPDLNVSL